MAIKIPYIKKLEKTLDTNDDIRIKGYMTESGRFVLMLLSGEDPVKSDAVLILEVTTTAIIVKNRKDGGEGFSVTMHIPYFGEQDFDVQITIYPSHFRIIFHRLYTIDVAYNLALSNIKSIFIDGEIIFHQFIGPIIES